MSGRGNLGATSEDHTELLTDNPNKEGKDVTVERNTGLSYHAWELKMKENPLPKAKALDVLRASNEANPTYVNRDVFSVVTDLDVLCNAFISMYCRYGSAEEAKLIN